MTTGTVTAPDGQSREVFPVAIGREEGVALRDWVRKEGSQSTIETGLAFAISTLYICEGLLANGPGRHVAIDPWQTKPGPNSGTTYAGAGLRTLEEAGVRDMVEFYEEESQTALPRLLRDGRRFDLAFIDGNHRFEAVFLDVVYAARVVKEGGIVFVDDTQLLAIRRSIEFCAGNLGWTIVDSGKDGTRASEWVVLRTGPAERLLRPYTEFVDFAADLRRRTARDD